VKRSEKKKKGYGEREGEGGEWKKEKGKNETGLRRGRRMGEGGEKERRKNK
jgi:hypothetical protein